MRAFIVGANGVLGRAVVDRLLDRGGTVCAMVRSRDRATAIDRDGVQLIEGDLLLEPPARLAEMIAGCDVVAHLATALRPDSPGFGTTNTNAALRTTGTRRLLDAALAAGVPRYIQQSIALAYVDGGDAWLDEATPFYRPEDAGGAAQPAVEMEAMVRALDPARVAWIILRGGAFVGRDTRQDDVIAGLRAGTVTVAGDGSNWVSFVHVGDYADAVVAAMHSEATGVTLNITDDPVRSGEYLDSLADILRVPRPARDPAAVLPRAYRCTSAAARDILGWRPRIGIWPRPADA